ncbi:cell division topological specificity factor [Clostridium acetireducens DSM 10703]|jgi:cell division topological specificity factor|uniref:Cell division topological specificity factor n=1 Tax=Clostridium acetireducens DSM 10703 TaxID=1121290 RepID=A0A1E8F200_9CLOT|nr:cell division topological specificity factor MinE [Clostridium acetireducens]OFI07224.1 cell division topological specificity factor [Clostridium acetireducens DSM 10703]
MDFFKLFSTKPSSKDLAKERLKLILIHDRATFSPEIIEKLKRELMEVISKYVDIEKDDLEIKMTKIDDDGCTAPALIASIPIKNKKK